jgi:acyl transferase domain-containing protein/NAD(P)H-dependent flavin oxidoreductase YrpB (nitropropane dioxygenase family)/NADP-dependent 3-hydroxy acid dehydrogenase YdfG
LALLSPPDRSPAPQLPSILGITPFERPDVPLAIGLARAGALAVLDLGRDPRATEDALRAMVRRVPGGFGVRIPAGVEVALPAEVRVVVLTAGARGFGGERGAYEGRVVLVQVTSIAEARAALQEGADGLIAKGSESGGRVGDEPSFILLQRILGEVRAPVWAQGGIGLHTAAACIAAGAKGVVLDSQLALLDESTAPAETKRFLRAMDGSETRVVAGERMIQTPDPLPAGQDASFARPLADELRSVETLVRRLRSAIDGHLRQARALTPLGPHSPLAVQHGTTYPIAQGPMTRVSDRAPFAAAVSNAGGLPFLALSLMRGDEARRALEETAALHRASGRSWGVGVLGFVPPEIRDEQLALLLEVRPTVALIAGGRPSHARPLEEAGIPTYLHVPSPGLLDLFLKDGARRFVFEGRECGGHVGPRSSFVLWESAIERLLAFPALHEVSVLFAGGVHDARSAAMVSAMGAPLAARGAKIGVLMGTAYLFTEEAVATGAIVPGFQQEAMQCDRTVLLETAPGHATRCSDTSYAQAFEAERARLEEAGKSKQEIWESLEQYNLGRLRMAAKGLAREGDALRSLDLPEQRQSGMYMIGQVAALRTGRCTMAELHRDVSESSAAILASARVPVDLRPEHGARPVDVAIVGMACIFPDAPNLQAFWKNIVQGANAIREVSPERWNPAQYFDPEGTGDKTPSKWGGFVPDVAFEPAAYGIPPRSLAAIDPVQLLSLEVAKKALEDAGYGDGASRTFDRERTSVIFGAESGTELAGAYGFRATYPQMLGELPPALEDHLPTLTEDSFAGVLANVIAGRIANRLDLGGANYTVDAACTSSLAAVDLACKELASGSSDMVIGGGADLHNSINDYLMFASVHALSPTGQCRSFDAKADGIVLGEGVAAVVLKRLADAERDGDRVYAVIKGVGASSDGKSLGLTAPRKEGQERALGRAYAAAGISPADVGLIEAHGTGTVVGDRTELAALTQVFTSAGATPAACTLGSVKSNIGHTKCAAGLAGLMKAALAVHHAVLPPTLNLETPNPFYDPTTSPFAFRLSASPWAASHRVAGVSAFGFGGTNFHAVIGSHDPVHDPRHPERSEGSPPEAAGGEAHFARGVLRFAQDDKLWPAELFLFRGAGRAAAESSMRALADRVSGVCTDRLCDLAASVGTTKGPVQAAIVASSVAELRTKLAAALGTAGAASARYSAEQVAFLFPGQGSQRPGMLADLFVTFPELSDLLGGASPWLPVLFPPAAFGEASSRAQKTAVTDTRVAQPALGMVELAIVRLLARFGLKPTMTAGHSYGELVALAAAGALPAAELIGLSSARALAIVDAAKGAPGTMAAASASPSVVRATLEGLAGITVANHNAPEQTVLAGSEEAVASAVERLGKSGIAARRIPVACAFHSPIVAGASVAFAEALARATVSTPALPVYANTSAAPYPSEPDAIRAQLARQLAEPVRFVEQIEAMYAAGARVFVEAGPGGVLSDLVARILKGRPHEVVRCDRAGMSGLVGLLEALAQLALAGIDVSSAALFAGREVRPLDLGSPAVGPSPTAWIVNGHSARPAFGELPEFALRIPRVPVSAAVTPAPAAVPVAGEREAALLEYLRAMRESAEAQRQVMLRYLGESAPQALALDSAAVAPLAPTRSVAPLAAVASVAPASAVRRSGRVTKAPPAQPHANLTPLEALIATVSERTGYPPEMLDPDLDLEADLGVDSIKRIEILGQLRDRLGLGTLSDQARSDALEELARFKTLRKIADWLQARVPSSAPAPAPAPALAPAPAPDAPPASDRKTVPVARYLLEATPVPAAVANCVRVEGRRFAIVPDRLGVALRLTELLSARGAKVHILARGEDPGLVDGVVHLESLGSESHDTVRSLFPLAQAAVRGRALWLVAATGMGGRFGLSAGGSASPGGVGGMLKSIAKELPQLRVRAIDLDPTEDTATLAANIYAELLADDKRVEVGYAGGVRHALTAVAGAAHTDGGGALELGTDAVVLVTGGARGITSEVAIELARRFRCTLELVGRSALGEPEDVELARAEDAPAVRRLLLERASGAGPATPATVERACRAVLASREVRRTVARIEEAGGRARYHAVDVRDARAFGALIDAIYERHGRIDGVVHGAGVIEDKLLGDKTRESFDRVFDTKVQSALTLGEKLRKDVRFVAFFSSVSGAFGNRGQVDYAAANDALDKLARQLTRRLAGRVLSVNWGPWGGVGMVSAELAREYAKRGVDTIAPDSGAHGFVDELCRGREPQVILAATLAGFA